MARIFITGSSDGLGLLAAKSFASMGHKVVLHARNEERAKTALMEVPNAEKVLIADLANIDETKRLAQEVNALGQFDTIIHNAGLGINVPVDAMSADNLPLVFAVNSLAPYILTAMINPPKRLIYMSSAMHTDGDASESVLNEIGEGKYVPNYCDTKLHDLILALATARLWPDVIVNAVHPGWVPTKMGGKEAPESLEEGYATQVWLAVDQDPEAMLSGRLLFHKEECDIKPQAKEVNIQSKFLSLCEQLSGVTIL